MRKIIQNLFKAIEHKNKLHLINELLVTDCSITESIDLFEKVKAHFLYSMEIERERMDKETRLIYGLNKVKKDYSACDKPLSEIETNFEIVSHE